MELIIKNFGPIAEGKIDLTKRFYLFVGYNNSGKTYVSNLLWSIFNKNTIFAFSVVEKFEEFDFENKNTFEINKKVIKSTLDKFNIFLKNKILPNNFKSDIFKTTDFKFNFDIQKVIILCEKIIIENNIIINNKKKESIKISFDKEDKQIKEIFHYIIFSALFNEMTDTFFLPAGRSFHSNYFLQMFRYEKLLSDKAGEILRNNEDLEKDDLSKVQKLLRRLYKESDNELFKKNYDLIEADEHKQIEPYKGFVLELEKIIGGDIIVDKDSRKLLFKFDKNDEALNMYMASSSVNQLTELYLYFKHWVQENANFLFIDEPEINLHPENQIKLLELLIKFSNINENKVLITTHSPLITEAINNYLLLSKLENKEEIAGKLGISETNLTAENTAIYFFNKRENEKFGEIREYKIGEYGTIFKDFNSVKDKIQDTNDELSEYYFKQKNK